MTVFTIALVVAVFGFMRGFIPLEHMIIIRNAKKYVIETYGLTPTEVRITNLFMGYPVYVLFEVEEHDFWFEVIASRFHYREWRDDYIIKLAESILVKDISVYLNEVLGENGSVDIKINSNRLENLTPNELQADPSLAFGIQEMYICRIFIYENPAQNNFDIDYKLLYNIYSHIFEVGLKPHSISFLFNNYNMNKRDIFLRVRVSDKSNTRYDTIFSDINSPNDLKQLFEKAIQEELNRNETDKRNQPNNAG